MRIPRRWTASRSGAGVGTGVVGAFVGDAVVGVDVALPLVAVLLPAALSVVTLVAALLDCVVVFASTVIAEVVVKLTAVSAVTAEGEETTVTSDVPSLPLLCSSTEDGGASALLDDTVSAEVAPSSTEVVALGEEAVLLASPAVAAASSVVAFPSCGAKTLLRRSCNDA